MTKKLLRLAAILFLLATVGTLCAAIPPAENLLPADTLAFFAVPDCAALRVTAKQSPGWLLWDDPAMKPFHDHFVAKWNEQYVAPLERDLGVKIDDFADLPQGQLTLAVTINGSNGHDDVPPGYLLLLDAKNKSDVLKTNLAALVKKWTTAGRALRKEEFHGLNFTVVPLSSNDFAGVIPKKATIEEPGKDAKPQKPGEIYFTQFQSLLIVGNSPKVVEPVAAHLTGGNAPAIADNSIFAADKLSQFRDSPEYYGWFNGKGFFDLLAQTQAPSGDSDSVPLMPSMSAAKVFNALGLSGMKSMSFAFRENHDGSSLGMHVTAPESSRAGLLKILAVPPKDASVPPFVPADTIKFSRIRLDGKQTWAELQKMMAEDVPNGQAILNSFISVANSQAKIPGFDLRNDLFGNLNDDIITYQKPPAGNSLEELNDPPTLYLVAVSNPDQTIAAVKTVMGIITRQENSKEPREFLGRKIHTVALNSVRTAGGTQLRSLYLSASSGYLAMSTDSGILEEYLRSSDGATKPLRENAGLQNAQQHLGGAGGGLFGYENQRETMRASFKGIKNAVIADTTLKLFPPAYRAWLDFSLLPDYEAVAKYFYISSFTSSANADGITFKVFTPRPPTLN